MASPGRDQLRLPSADRRKAGRTRRDDLPFRKLSRWSADAGERYPIVMLSVRDAQRIPSLLPERNFRMARSPASFLRGAATIMAADLGTGPSTGILVQACGDCHLMNFGAFLSPEGEPVFDVNDFDETLRAPFEWDLKRLGASLAVAGHDAGLEDDACRELARDAVSAYVAQIHALAEMTPLEAWRFRIDLKEAAESISDPTLRDRVHERLREIRKARESHFGIVANHKGTPRLIKDGARVLALSEQEYATAEAAFLLYLDSLQEDRRILLDRYDVADIAFKAVGIGSVGTFCAIVLLASADGAPLLLQIKQAEISALARYAGASPYDNQGQRVVIGQRMMQATPDIFLGWTRDRRGRDFYARRLKDARLAAIGEDIGRNDLPFYAPLCGRTLARAHARSGDAAMIGGYAGGGSGFVDAIADFAMAYAEQTRRDFQDFTAAIAARVIPCRKDRN
jgi:uncharacterized protein (DUF2252 family)